MRVQHVGLVGTVAARAVALVELWFEIVLRLFDHLKLTLKVREEATGVGLVCT